MTATFVLVHGPFLGGWGFRRVASQLERAGHNVFTPTLTGIGERSHLLGPHVGLSTHIEDITNVLVYEDLRDVILVGQSYGGMVITGVADRVPERIAQLVYVNGHVPTNGRNAMGGFGGGTADKLGEMSGEEGPRLLPPFPFEAMGIYEPEDRAWVGPRLTPHPMKCLEEPIVLAHGEPRMPRAYVYGTAREDLIAFLKADPIAHFVEKARADGFAFYELTAGLFPMISHPKELAEVLERIASSAR
ncbi:alpha/beta hydrolase [Polyangium mundeleinium]|uniref:Alpha/beta hydrolase n=1 Tax=Polyangium mundeleinium TaxID=2995306 RepID=A0ABT5EG23_9BACT|nr:alpha/beta hydrolase [Polyangium mundeleinium]MDC0740279.1 alpha/beta hydrolase [Polyangium mundeleinium]